MKEFFKALIAGFGCTPMLAVSVFISGAFFGQFITVQAPPPPQWLLIPAALFPVTFGLYLRAYAREVDMPDWLEQWRQARRQRVVGHVAKPGVVEEVWLQTEVRQRSPQHFLARLLDDDSVWGWAALITFLPLAYICLWYGLTLG